MRIESLLKNYNLLNIEERLFVDHSPEEILVYYEILRNFMEDRFLCKINGVDYVNLNKEDQSKLKRIAYSLFLRSLAEEKGESTSNTINYRVS